MDERNHQNSMVNENDAACGVTKMIRTHTHTLTEAMTYHKYSECWGSLPLPCTKSIRSTYLQVSSNTGTEYFLIVRGAPWGARKIFYYKTRETLMEDYYAKGLQIELNPRELAPSSIPFISLMLRITVPYLEVAHNRMLFCYRLLRGFVSRIHITWRMVPPKIVIFAMTASTEFLSFLNMLPR